MLKYNSDHMYNSTNKFRFRQLKPHQVDWDFLIVGSI